MLRFIIKRSIKADGHVSVGYETMDISVPELEEALLGGGSSENSFDHRELAGVEILPHKPDVEEQAAMYNWLRNQNWHDSSMFVVTGGKGQVKMGTFCPSGEQLDNFIREQMQNDDPQL